MTLREKIRDAWPSPKGIVWLHIGSTMRDAFYSATEFERNLKYIARLLPDFSSSQSQASELLKKQKPRRQEAICRLLCWKVAKGQTLDSAITDTKALLKKNREGRNRTHANDESEGTEQA